MLTLPTRDIGLYRADDSWHWLLIQKHASNTECVMPSNRTDTDVFCELEKMKAADVESHRAFHEKKGIFRTRVPRAGPIHALGIPLCRTSNSQLSAQ